MISLIFLLSCSSERALQTGSSEQFKPIKRFSTSKGSDAPSTKAAPALQERETDTRTRKNAPPELTRVKLAPEVFHLGDTLRVEASASDPDGDNVSIRYAWFVNDQAAGDTSHLAEPVKRGDHLRVRVTPFDGKEKGRSAILRTEIKNMPPMFRRVGQGVFNGETYTCQVTAEDPDGDPLTYLLKTAPSGMKISPDTGIMTWNVPADFTGVEKIRVTAEDGHGGKAEYTLKVTIKEEESDT